MNIEKIINLIVEDLQANATPFDIYAYEVKATHQIIRKHITEQLKLYGVVVPKGTLCDKNENKLGMCNCCGDNNCHNSFCKG